MQGVCRVGDAVTGICQASAPGHPRNFSGVWTEGSDIITADDIGVVRIGDCGITDCGHVFMAVEGSDVITADDIGVVREGDVVLVLQGGTGVAAEGSDTVTAE